MTAEEKRNRRKLRHELQRAFRQNFMHRMGMRSTTGAIHAAIKTHADKQAQQLRKTPMTAHSL